MRAVRPTVAFVFALSVACRPGATTAHSKTTGSAVVAPAGGSASGSASDVVEPVNPPVDVAGAYLVDCSADTKTSFAQDVTAGEDLTACTVHDDKGRLLEKADGLSVTIAQADGTNVPGVLAAKETDAPWLVGFHLPLEALGDVQAIKLAFTVGGKDWTTSTDKESYDWGSSAEFRDYLTAVLTKNAPESASAPQNTGSIDGGGGGNRPGSGTDENGSDGIEEGAPVARTIVFATSHPRPGNLTLAAADAECVDAGSRAFDGLTAWAAVLATSDKSARDRLKLELTGPVFDVVGGKVADSLDDFFAKDLLKAVQYDDRRMPLSAALNAPTLDRPEPLEFNPNVWSGVKGGTCDDWSSADPKLTGGTAALDRAGSDWLGAGKRSCLRKARILCIGRGIP